MARYSTEAIVIKRINYSDSDRIYTLLTPDKGKITAMAKGVRKISSKKSGTLDTLNHLSIQISETNTGFKYIQEVQGLNSFRNIKSDLDNSFHGYYLVELVNKSVEEGPDTYEIFTLLKNSLELMDMGQDAPTLIVSKFEFLLMKLLGYEMSLEDLKKVDKKSRAEVLSKYVKDNLGEDFSSLRI